MRTTTSNRHDGKVCLVLSAPMTDTNHLTDEEMEMVAEEIELAMSDAALAEAEREGTIPFDEIKRKYGLEPPAAEEQTDG